jgi:hypothetical protein
MKRLSASAENARSSFGVRFFFAERLPFLEASANACGKDARHEPPVVAPWRAGDDDGAQAAIPLRAARSGRREHSNDRTGGRIARVGGAESGSGPIGGNDDLRAFLGAPQGAGLDRLPGALTVLGAARGGARPGNPRDVGDLDGPSNATR